jgi:hypothetical protein
MVQIHLPTIYVGMAQRQTQQNTQFVPVANSRLKLFTKVKHSLVLLNRGSQAGWGRSGFDSRALLYLRLKRWSNDKAPLVRNDLRIKCREQSIYQQTRPGIEGITYRVTMGV